MNQMLGMDVHQIRGLAASMQTKSTLLTNLTESLSSSLANSGWCGPNAEEFTQLWYGQLRPQLTTVAEAMRTAGDVLTRNADDQQQTSDSLFGANAGGGFLSGLGDAWDAFTGGIHDGFEWLGDQASDLVDWTADRISDGIDWATQVFDDVVLERFRVTYEGLLRTGQNAQAFAEALKDGKVGSVAEFLAGSLTVGGSLLGTNWNLLTGRDLHLFDDGRPRVGEVEWIEGADLPAPPQSFEEFTRLTMGSYGSHDDPSKLTVTVVEDAAGEPRFIVTFPGTEADIKALSGWNAQEKPNNWSANMFAMGMGTSTYQQGLEEALERAIDSYREQTGFTGTPRLLLGTHSQAGIVGTNMAADAAFRQKYHIDGVVTFGAPFKSSNDLGGVPLMSIENDSRYGILPFGGDPVPKPDLGGIGNPRGEYGVNDVTKIFTPPVTNSWNPFEAHKQANYEMAVDRMLSPSATGGWATSGQTLREWERSAGLNDYYQGSTVQQLQVEVSREQ